MKWSGCLAVGVVVVFGVAQFVPYGRAHTNPPVVVEPQWSSPEARALAKRACFDCHSNESRGPWYTNVAPVSWLVQHEVEEGRAMLNFSEWNRPQEEAAEAAETIDAKEMPPALYLPLHPNAKLSDLKRTQLATGLRAMFGAHADERDD